MSKYNIMLTEAEARALRAIYDNPEITKRLPLNVLDALIKIGEKIERQADWKTW